MSALGRRLVLIQKTQPPIIAVGDKIREISSSSSLEAVIFAHTQIRIAYKVPRRKYSVETRNPLLPAVLDLMQAPMSVHQTERSHSTISIQSIFESCLRGLKTTIVQDGQIVMKLLLKGLVSLLIQESLQTKNPLATFTEKAPLRFQLPALLASHCASVVAYCCGFLAAERARGNSKPQMGCMREAAQKRMKHIQSFLDLAPSATTDMVHLFLFVREIVACYSREAQLPPVQINPHSSQNGGQDA